MNRNDRLRGKMTRRIQGRPAWPLGLALLLAAWIAASGAAAPARAADPPELLRLDQAKDYRAWMERFGWENLRPISDSTKRFRLEEGALRMESRADSYLIGSALEGILPLSIIEYPYLRFVVRIERAPAGADLTRERLDDSAFRLYAVTRVSPPQAIVYAWTWSHPIGEWSAQGMTSRGYFNNVRHKSIGLGEPPAGQWLTVEANLLEDFRSQFPEYKDPILRGISLKADSNDTERASSLAWLRTVSLHRESLRRQELKEGDPLGETVLWYR